MTYIVYTYYLFTDHEGIKNGVNNLCANVTKMQALLERPELFTTPTQAAREIPVLGPSHKYQLAQYLPHSRYPKNLKFEPFCSLEDE